MRGQGLLRVGLSAAVVCLLPCLPTRAQCVGPNRPPSSPGYQYIRVVVTNPGAAPVGANEAVTTAGNEWNATCGGYSGAIPEIWTSAGTPPGPFAQMNLTFVNISPVNDGRCGRTEGNIIEVYSFTRTSPGGSLIACSTRGSWNDIIAHEFGHRMGLADANDSNACRENMMAQANGMDRSLAANGGEVCQDADAQNVTLEERGVCSVQDCHQSPLVLAMPGTPYRFTCVDDGVWFDLTGDGVPERAAWTKAGDAVGFLALDRDRNGSIDSGRELFGTSTPLLGWPDDFALNGFDALGQYDSDEDSWITPRDPVWADLWLWFDWDHDGVSGPTELVALAEAEVLALEVTERASPITDACGNELRLRARTVFATPHGPRVRQWFDVFLAVDPP